MMWKEIKGQAQKLRDLLKKHQLPFCLAFYHTFDDKGKPKAGYFSVSGGDEALAKLIEELTKIHGELLGGERVKRSCTFKADPPPSCELEGG